MSRGDGLISILHDSNEQYQKDREINHTASHTYNIHTVTLTQQQQLALLDTQHHMIEFTCQITPPRATSHIQSVLCCVFPFPPDIHPALHPHPYIIIPAIATTNAITTPASFTLVIPAELGVGIPGPDDEATGTTAPVDDPVEVGGGWTGEEVDDPTGGGIAVDGAVDGPGMIAPVLEETVELGGGTTGEDEGTA